MVQFSQLTESKKKKKKLPSILDLIFNFICMYKWVHPIQISALSLESFRTSWFIPISKSSWPPKDVGTKRHGYA